MAIITKTKKKVQGEIETYHKQIKRETRDKRKTSACWTQHPKAAYAHEDLSHNVFLKDCRGAQETALNSFFSGDFFSLRISFLLWPRYYLGLDAMNLYS